MMIKPLLDLKYLQRGEEVHVNCFRHNHKSLTTTFIGYYLNPFTICTKAAD
jgi:hypothetical protein